MIVDPARNVSPQDDASDSPDPSRQARAVADLSTNARALINWFRGRGRVMVAFSGGVDSSVVLAAAVRAGCASVVGATANSPSVPRWQLELAASVASDLNVEHRVIATGEVELPEYRANDQRRCFHCKSTLYGALAALAAEADQRTFTLVSGTNLDDLGDYRPGIQAGDDAGVLKPLAELGFGKSAVRSLADEFGLSNARLPASPCLASRVAYGVEVTPERLRRIELAEDHLRELGLSTFRVRLHSDELARVEVPADAIGLICDEQIRVGVITRLTELGFRYVTLDLQGFSSGSMNRSLVMVETIGSGQTGKIRKGQAMNDNREPAEDGVS